MTERQGYLYIDDDAISRKAMRIIIEKHMQALVTIFEDSNNILEKLQALPQPPKIILLDIHMQPYTGFEVLVMIRQLSEYQTIPIIALTASVMNEEISKIREAGFNGAIAKPFSIQTLPQALTDIENGLSVWKITS